MNMDIKTDTHIYLDMTMEMDMDKEYELLTEAHAQLFVVGNCSRFCLPVCSGGGETAGGWGMVSSSRGWEERRQTAQYTQG